MEQFHDQEGAQKQTSQPVGLFFGLLCLQYECRCIHRFTLPSMTAHHPNQALLMYGGDLGHGMGMLSVLCLVHVPIKK